MSTDYYAVCDRCRELHILANDQAQLSEPTRARAAGFIGSHVDCADGAQAMRSVSEGTMLSLVQGEEAYWDDSPEDSK